MTYRVGYFLPASEPVYDVIRHALPADMHLVTLATRDPQEAIQCVPALDFLISVKAPAELLEAARKLRLLQLPGVGHDQVDLEAAAKAGIPVALSLAGGSDAVAEHALLLMLAVSRRVVELAGSLRAGQWWMWERRTVSYGLNGKTLGIVGMGRIGYEVALRAAAFGMRILYTDVVATEGYERSDLDSLLRASDYVTLHTPLTDSTRGLLNQARIAQMKPGAILINTARGEIVDEAALTGALESGQLAGAGLDVFQKEPPDPANPLLHMPQVVATPHVATGTLDSLLAKAAFYVENFRRVVRGEEPAGLIVPSRGRS
jgi:D-3-phosphoglycerate dehydrogenase